MFSTRNCLAFTILVAFPLAATAQLRFTQSAVSMGELRGGPSYQHRFEFVNDSAKPIEITDLRLGCGCLQPVLDKRIYQPGEKGTLVMNIRTLGQPNGLRAWKTQVQYRSGEQMLEVALVLEAKIRNEVTVEPDIVAMTVETTLKQDITFTDHRPLPTRVTEFRASSPAIRVSTQALGNGVTKITLEVSRAALTANRQEETLTICTDDPHYRQLQVPITLVKAIRAEVTATPSKVELIGAASQLVRLRGAGDQVVRIAKAQADDPAIKCTWAAGPGNDATLKISADAAKVTAGLVHIQLAEPAGATLTISVTARAE